MKLSTYFYINTIVTATNALLHSHTHSHNHNRINSRSHVVNPSPSFIIKRSFSTRRRTSSGSGSGSGSGSRQQIIMSRLSKTNQQQDELSELDSVVVDKAVVKDEVKAVVKDNDSKKELKSKSKSKSKHSKATKQNETKEMKITNEKKTDTKTATKKKDTEKDKEKTKKAETVASKTASTTTTAAATATTTKAGMKSVSARYVHDNDLYLTTDDEGRITARPISMNEESDDQGKGKNQVDNVSIDAKEKSKQKIPKSEKRNDEQVVVKSNKTKNNNDDDDDITSDTNTITNNDKEPIQQTQSSSTIPLSASIPIKTKPKPGERTTIKIPGITLPKITKIKPLLEDVPKPVISGGFNVVLTHCTADFDSLASAVGLAKLWSTSHPSKSSTSASDAVSTKSKSQKGAFETSSSLPTFVVLPRGAHPSVQRFLALHKHLFPIRSLRSLPNDLTKLNRLGLVDAQRRDRVGPAEILIGNADRVTIVDHHIDGTSDIPEATDYIVDQVGSVSTMVAEQLRECGFELTEAEATLLALGIHADTGSLCFDSTTTRDAEALAWVMKQGASQAAIAENAHASLSQEQQGVLTNALINTNSTVVHGVTVSTVLLSADGFINGLAAVTQDALELSSSDVFLLAVVYDPKSGGKGKGKGKGKAELGVRLQSKLLKADEDAKRMEKRNNFVMEAEAWKGGERAMKLRRLRAAFDKKDADGNGYLEEDEIAKALAKAGVIASQNAMKALVKQIDTDGDGRIDFDEFVTFSDNAEKLQEETEQLTGKKATTMIVIGRVKAGVNMKHVNLNRLFQQFGGGGHAKAASCTVRLEDESTAGTILQGIVDELIETGLMQQATVGDFMTSPVLSAKPTMTEKQVEDLFVRYDVRALPVVDDKNDVVGLVTYKEVAAAKQRLWNKEQKRIRQEAKMAASNAEKTDNSRAIEHGKGKARDRKLGSALKGWMKQHVKTVDASMTMAEVEHILLENDVGCIPVVADGTTQLVGMVTRTDLLRQHRYYPSLHYNNKGFADSIAARKPIIELRKKLKQFDLDEE